MPSQSIYNSMERWYALADSVFDQMRLEIGQIDLLLETYAAVLHHAHHHTPDLVQVTAIAAILHSFYNGTVGCVKNKVI